MAWNEAGQNQEKTPSISTVGVDEQEKRQFEKNMEYLQALIENIRASGKPVAVLYNPLRAHVGPKAEEPPPWYDKFRHWLDHHNVPMIDLQAKWKGKEEANEYYRDYIHPNQRGNIILAKAINRFVRHQHPQICR
jgi:lysophospholipase L1-like esterase